MFNQLIDSLLNELNISNDKIVPFDNMHEALIDVLAGTACCKICTFEEHMKFSPSLEVENLSSLIAVWTFVRTGRAPRFVYGDNKVEKRISLTVHATTAYTTLTSVILSTTQTTGGWTVKNVFEAITELFMPSEN